MKTKYFFSSIALILFLFGCSNENNSGIIPEGEKKGVEGAQTIYFTWTLTDESGTEASFTTSTTSATNEILIDWGDGTKSLSYSGNNGLNDDGTNSRVLTIIHTYTDVGTYNVKVTAEMPYAFEFFSVNNQVSSLDVSECVNLTSLYCSFSQLTDLDLSNNKDLESLYCTSNQLTHLDLSNNTNLRHLECYSNQLTDLDLSNNKLLEWLCCSSNQLTHLDLGNNTDLRHLDCSSNQLTNLDLSNNKLLEWLCCSSNQLIHLDLSNNEELRELLCDSNQLTHLDLSSDLMDLECSFNQLTDLDLSSSKSLYSLRCHSNQLTHLDLSNNTDLSMLHCYSNKLTSLDISNNRRSLSLLCYNNSIPLVDLFNASEIIKDSEFGTNRSGTQTLETVTWYEESAVIDSVFWGNGTSFDVTLDGKAAITNKDYSITDGTISFLNKGLYSITISNPMIVSDPEFPAKVIANFNIPYLQSSQH